MSNFTESYRKAGVDVEAGYKAVNLMKEHVEKTQVAGVLGGIGSFGGMFEPNLEGISRPVLVSGTDGGGTKLMVAFLMDKHDTIGVDCVAMSVNDIICQGAAPMFFIDYIACDKVIPEKIADIVKGISEGCVQANCALIGGETAEMPGIYNKDEYDLAGFAVGMVDYKKIITPKKIGIGDVLIALPSSGLHSNGFSLVRKILQVRESNINLHIDELGKTIGEELLTPTKIYVKPILNLLKDVDVTGVCNITGGGFYENIPRILGENHRAIIEKNTLNPHPIFNVLAKTGNVPEGDMFHTFNMGVGMVVAVHQADANAALKSLKDSDEDAFIMGSITDDEKGIEIV